DPGRVLERGELPPEIGELPLRVRRRPSDRREGAELAAALRDILRTGRGERFGDARLNAVLLDEERRPIGEAEAGRGLRLLPRDAFCRRLFVRLRRHRGQRERLLLSRAGLREERQGAGEE